MKKPNFLNLFLFFCLVFKFVASANEPVYYDPYQYVSHLSGKKITRSKNKDDLESVKKEASKICRGLRAKYHTDKIKLTRPVTRLDDDTLININNACAAIANDQVENDIAYFRFAQTPKTATPTPTPKPIDYSYDLLNAVKSNDIKKIQELLNKGADPKAFEKDRNYSLLFEASSPEVILVLIKAGVNINARKNKLTPLETELAKEAKSVNWKIVKTYLNAMENLEQKAITQGALDRLLAKAVNDDDYDLANAALKNGANPNAQDADGWTALITNILYNLNPEILNLLLINDADPNLGPKGITSLSALLTSCHRNKSEDVEKALELLLKYGARFNASVLRAIEASKCTYLLNNEELLWDAINKGDSESFKLLIKHNADLSNLSKKSKEDETPLEFIKKHRKQEFIKALNEHSKSKWSLDDNGNVIYQTTNGTKQTVETPVPFVTLTVSPDASQVWGIDGQNKIYYRTGITRENPEGKDWVIVPGLLKQIVILPDNNIWAINMGGAIFFTNKNTDANPGGIGWQFIPGDYLSSIAVTDDGQVTGITLDGKEVKRLGIIKDNPMGTSWDNDIKQTTQTPQEFATLTVSPDTSQVWGIDS